MRAMSHAVLFHETGSPDVLRWEARPPGEPGPGEVLVRHTAIGLNYIDTYHRSGLYPVPSLPSGLGVEAAGVVEALGPGVEELEVGARVAYASGGVGAYAERRCIAARHLVPVPDEIGLRTAAAVLLKGLTVEYLIRRCYPVRRGQTVLLHAAAGGVGLLACQWLAHLGVTVIGTVSTPEKAKLAAAYGCTYPIVSSYEDFPRRVRELTAGAGVPVVFDSVGKDTFERSLDCLSPRGTLVSFGNASGKPAPLDIGVLAQKGSLYVTRPILGSYIEARQELLDAARAVFDMVRRRHLHVVVGQEWALAEASSAHRALESRSTTGTSLLIP